METPVKKKSYGKANRARGHKYEVDVARWFRQWFPHVITSRLGNRQRDGEGIDLCHADELKNGRFPFNVQLKASTKIPSVPEIFKRISSPDAKGLLFWRHAERSEVKVKKDGTVKGGGQVMVLKNEYVIMERETFNCLLEGYLKSLNIPKHEAPGNR